MNCGSCKHWARTGALNTGQCRVRAPAIGFAQVVEVVTVPRRFLPPRVERIARIERCTSFPITEEDCYCGEWRALKTIKNKSAA